ncbi:type II toxin-antitoxin system HicA family toxin [Pseudomonadota bacterium]
MPPKIRQLIKLLEKAGFEDRGGKGSHRKFKHPSGLLIVISGKPGSDAKPYQIFQVQKLIKLAKNETK